MPTFDLVTLSIVIVVVAGSALAASWYPARRAARYEPVEALRSS